MTEPKEAVTTRKAHMCVICRREIDPQSLCVVRRGIGTGYCHEICDEAWCRVMDSIGDFNDGWHLCDDANRVIIQELAIEISNDPSLGIKLEESMVVVAVILGIEEGRA